MTFGEFADRKTREASRAQLPPYVTELERPTADAAAIASAWTSRVFDGPFYASPPGNPRRPACSLVFVQSADGNTGSGNPTALGGGETDKHLIYEGLSRVAADAVMAGAETIRNGNTVLSVWHPELVRLRASLGKPRHPMQIVATLRGIDLNRGILFNTPEIRVVLLTVESCALVMRQSLVTRPWISTVAMSHPAELQRAFEVLRDFGVERLSCVGGRRVATQLIDAGLVDDLYLTTSPRPGGEPETPIYPGRLAGRVIVRKRGTGPEEGVTFEHMVMT
jgi:riboflavin biosynthesis pyrimidine reductase